MYGQNIMCGISKAPFEIRHKISYPYIEKYDFYTTLKFQELLDLRAHMRFWNAPPDHTHRMLKKYHRTLTWETMHAGIDVVSVMVVTLGPVNIGALDFISLSWHRFQTELPSSQKWCFLI